MLTEKEAHAKQIDRFLTLFNSVVKDGVLQVSFEGPVQIDVHDFDEHQNFRLTFKGGIINFEGTMPKDEEE